ncbi:MAG: ATP-binding cassette domain-containing protein [Lachnospiraceae bacterium]|nr:ATP-binding cassette domain-containing protein [Lachnospiraceae bacterium]
MSETVIKVDNLKKTYKIHEKQEGFKNSVKDFFSRKYIYKEAVKDISFSIERGSIVGFLGKNGAGKTTTLKMLSGVLHPTGGDVEILGYNPIERKRDYLKRISFVMGNKSSINWNLPAIDSLKYQQLLYDVSPNEFKDNLELLVDMMEAQKLLNIPLRRLSLGERMKMELINSFLYFPEVIFLDEPTIGLDLDSQYALRSFVKKYVQERNATVIITSHYMDDIEDLCERIILIDEGKIHFDDDIAILKSNNLRFRENVLELMKEIRSKDK